MVMTSEYPHNYKKQYCALCSEIVSLHPMIDGDHIFCCTGCYTVFNILTAKNQLEGFEHNPLFLQALHSGIISNPALLEHLQRQQQDIEGGERNKYYMEIGEMWCPSCAEIIRLMLLMEKGVINCVVDYATDLAAIEFSPRHISKDRIKEMILRLGYRPIPLGSHERNAVSTSLYLRTGIAVFCALNIMMFAYPLYATYFDYDGENYGFLFARLSFILSLPVIFYCGWPIWRRFMTSLKNGYYGMETLVAIGVWSAFGLSINELISGGTRVYFDSMSVIIALVLLGKIIETKAKFSAKESLMRLSLATPRRGRKVFADGSLHFVPIKEIAKGDCLVAYTGEKIALDGVIVEGQGACDESLMTGEAIPVVKKIGVGVIGGTILVQGHLTYKIVGTSDEMVLHKIIEMVEHDIGHKSIYVRAADRVVRWFVPIVIAIAALTALFCWQFPLESDLNPNETALMRALAVLLISCPCAIGIAAPAAESYLLNGLASLGAIVRNRGCLPHLGGESIVIFDKTGTVTEGLFSVLSGIDHLSSEDKAALRNLSMHSTHPVSLAVSISVVREKLLPVTSLEEVAGYGLRGVISNSQYYLGSARFLKQHGIDVSSTSKEVYSEVPISHVYFAKDKICLSHIVLGDSLRPGIKGVIASLHPAQTILLSGDAEISVAAIAKLCGFTQWRSQCTPMEKREYVDSLRQKGNIVCMLGDGINDAPALTAAHVGISVVSASEMSIQVSDILLTTDRLEVIVKIRSLAQKGQKIVRQNLFWAFFYNVVGIFLAAFGVLSPIFAAFAMSVSSLTVLFNARRLNKTED